MSENVAKGRQDKIAECRTMSQLCSIFSTSVRAYKHTATTEKERITQNSSLISQDKVDKEKVVNCRSVVCALPSCCRLLLGFRLTSASPVQTRATCLRSIGNAPPICTAIRPPVVTLCLAGFQALKKRKRCNTHPSS